MPIKNTWHDWLHNYIPEPKESADGFKDKVSLLKTNTSKKQCMGEERNQANQKHKNNLKNIMGKKDHEKSK